MLYKQPGSRFYWTKFRFQKRLVRKSTGCTTAKAARIVESKIRLELANGNWKILEPPEAVPTLGNFIKQTFLPHIEKVFPASSKTLEYYRYGATLLAKSGLANLHLDKISDKHARQFDARYSSLKASTRNCGLRTLRRLLSYAADGSKRESGLHILDRSPKIPLAENENRRERVLSKEEALAYLAACKQPWRDVALIILSTGSRPSEVYALCWDQLEWRDGSAIIFMGEGKTIHAKRPLPLLREAYQVLRSRYEAQGYPVDGWVFPSESESGHLMQGSAKNQHQAALRDSGVKPFAPYTLRHTGLTWIAPYCDSYTLSKIAGHSSVSMTSRYIHPAQHTIEATFQKMAARQKVVIGAGHSRKLLESLDHKSADLTIVKSND